MTAEQMQAAGLDAIEKVVADDKAMDSAWFQGRLDEQIQKDLDDELREFGIEPGANPFRCDARAIAARLVVDDEEHEPRTTGASGPNAGLYRQEAKDGA